MDSYAFISYQTSYKAIACRVKEELASIGINSFLAHEDIDVSADWRIKLLEELKKADLFICLLSKSYFSSAWCAQESGIAAFRDSITIIPLSIDGGVPEGFISNIQSTKVDADKVSLNHLLPGLVKHNAKQTTDEIIKIIGRSNTYDWARENFQLILPYINKLTDEQIMTLLKVSANNSQVYRGATEHIEPLLKSHGHLLDTEKRVLLEGICDRYLDRKKDWEEMHG
jgi:hypothetical protein